MERMNERIRELAEHCDFYIGNEHYDKSHEEQQRLFKEKFAELIVRECIQVGGPEDSYRDDWFKAKADSVAKIKQYFGVE